MPAVDVTDDIGVGFQHHILADETRAGNGRTAGVDRALDAVLARPANHLPCFLATLDRAETDLTEQPHARGRQFRKIRLDHTALEYRRAREHLDPGGSEVRKGALRRDGQRLEADEILRSAGKMNLARRDQRADATVQRRVDPTELVLPRRPVADHGVHV